MAQHARNKSSSDIILPRVKDHMLKEYGWDADRDPTVIHPSEMAKSDWCLRGTYLRIISGQWPPSKEKFDFVRENIFATGNDIHAKWQDRIIDAGFAVWGDWQCYRCKTKVTGLKPPDEYAGCCIATLDWHDWRYDEVTLNARSELLIAGHADVGVLSDGFLVEIKSVGLGTVRIDAPDLLKAHQNGKHTDLTGLWRGIRRPLKSHLIQGDIYLHLAHVLGLPFTKIVYLYEFKPNQMTKEFTIEYNPGRSAKLIAKADIIRYAVEQRIPPPCIKPGECKQCDAFRVRRTVAGTRDTEQP
jgi:hypothetical protein